jgi:hypothetical protein
VHLPQYVHQPLRVVGCGYEQGLKATSQSVIEIVWKEIIKIKVEVKHTKIQEKLQTGWGVNK